ncbi:uncharacterized protein LOC122248628 [Penaeus japonicus]|uniref:uncharacterized protein LOC122248628 n=1 Tax=Penaeus japonicus TaxID=27405 RepID=UPI001C70FB00|nr:uncharacterized protein LOC122248628 [Penaeus japonicus]
MRKVLFGLPNTECYFDNIVVHNSSWDDHIVDVKALLQRLREHGLTAGPDIVAPVNVLLKRFSSNILKWTNEQIERIDILKEKLANPPILVLPDYSRTFYLRTDASDTGCVTTRI